MKSNISGIEENFVINKQELSYTERSFPFTVNSFPRPYEVDIIKNISEYENYLRKADFIIIDSNIHKIYRFENLNPNKLVVIESREENKNLATVETIIEKLIENDISKGSLVIAVGGGIIQDISACACALLRRGQPFVYFPTTTLGQLDSCVGAKCAINTVKAKNILGLFSAPKQVKIPIFMINSMPQIDHIAGISEMLRLCLTGSNSAINKYQHYLNNIKVASNIDNQTYCEAIKLSLSIKKSVVDFDEYEKDIRRSMNYGHTFGHAIEKSLNFKIPHGIGVLLGMHIANIYANKISLMNNQTFYSIKQIFKNTAENINFYSNHVKKIVPNEIIDLFKFDKKGDGESVPLVLLEKPGLISFHRHFFSSKNEALESSIHLGIKDFCEWINS